MKFGEKLQSSSRIFFFFFFFFTFIVHLAVDLDALVDGIRLKGELSSLVATGSTFFPSLKFTRAPCPRSIQFI